MQNELFLAPVSRSGSAFEHLMRSVIEGITIEDLAQNDGVNKDDPARIWGLTTGLRGEWESVGYDDWLLFYTGDARYEYAAQISGEAQRV